MMFTGRMHDLTSKAGAARRYAVTAVARVKQAATDPRVHRETHGAANDAAQAWRRAERVGLTRAVHDRRVARSLRRAERHASRAARLVMSSPPRHRLRNGALLVAGVGAGAAGVVAARGTIRPAPGATGAQHVG